MRKFVNSIIHFRWFIALIIPILTIVLAFELRNIEFEGSYRVWFSEESESLKKYDRFRAVFGNDDAIIITFSDENGIMNPKALGVIDRLTNKLWETKNIARVDSLTNYQYVHSNPEEPDDIIVEDFFEDISSLTALEFKQKEEIALKEDLLVNRIISSDGKTTMIVGRLTPKVGDIFGAVKEVGRTVQGYVDEESKNNGYEFHLAGGPILNLTFSTLGKSDITTFTPIILLIAMILLWIIFRRSSGMLLSIAVVMFTFIIVLAIQVLLGYKINNFTANMPVFIIAIGIADAMHLYWIYLIGRKKGLDNHEAIHYSVEKNFLPIFLTSVTTAVGFASLSISAIVPIETLGVATANAALLAFALTVLFVPAVLAIINPKVKEKEIKSSEEKPNKIALLYAEFIIKHDTKIILATVIIFGIIGFGLTKLQIDSNTVRYFNEDVPFRKTVTFIEDKLTGPMSYEIVLDSKIKDGIKSSEFMHMVEKFSNEFKSKYPDVRHTSSLVDVVKKFNEVMTGEKNIPDNQNLIAQYLLLYSLSLPQGMEINDKMDVDERFLRLTASMNIVDTSLDLEMIKWAEEWWKTTPYSVSINGQTVMFAHMQHDVTDTLVESIILAISVVSIMMLLIFKSFRMVPLFIIPNILPIVLVVGVMGWLGITVDIGVAISGAIILGVAVDDTIHFLVKYKEARKKGYNFKDSLVYIMHYAGSAIIFTTIILSTSFMIFSFSQFNPNVNFGIVTAIALIIAVAVDLIMLPAILSRYDGKEKSFLS
ncbi:MMPL family transporter [Sulfurimonas aquatica]|uniref:MMPL family transporter n=1 Tax=Sulfurimonas aquatica TaxID=2672570 RepID=A0A975B1N3_9BACT|nr:MMPL family transporter [Sulfurimonas aquatica]QSZ42596.1 MMPL family transporter [Sulfurimonas aquatica]